MQESSALLATICQWNPFSNAVELVRFAFYGQFNFAALAIVIACTALFFVSASWSYNPARRFRAARTAAR